MNKKKIYGISILVILSILSLTICIIGRKAFGYHPFHNEYKLNNPSYIYHMEQGGNLIIENSKSSILVTNKNNQLKTIINGGKKSENAFYYSNGVVSDGQYIYINDVHYGDIGVKIVYERIAKFDMNGKFVENIYEQKYSPNSDDLPMQYGLITNLESKNGVVTFFLRSNYGYRLYSVKNSKANLIYQTTKAVAKKAYNLTYDNKNKRIYFSSKSGEIYQDDGSQIKCIYSSKKVEKGFPSVPWKVFTDDSGDLYYTDLGTRQLINLSKDEVLIDASKPFDKSPVYNSGTSNGKILAVTDGNKCCVINTQGSILFDGNQVKIEASVMLEHWIVWVCGILLSVIFVISFLFLIYAILSSKSHTLKVGFWVGTGIIVVSVIVAVSIFSGVIVNTTNRILHNIEATASIVSENTKGKYGDMIDDINSLSDYDSLNYQEVKKYLDIYSDEAYNAGIYQYSLLYKVKDNVLYAIMDYEDTVTPIHPYLEYHGSGYEAVLEKGKTITVGGEANTYGLWAYSAAPIYNSRNEIVAIVEIGTDLNSEYQQIHILVKLIITSVVVLVIIIFLLLTEGIYLSNYLEKRRSSKLQNIPCDSLGYVRFLSFLIFFADSFQDSFLPIVSTGLFEKAGKLFSWLGATGSALPMSIQLLCVALMGIVGGKMIDKFNIKSVACIGLTIQALGYILSGIAVYSSSYGLLLLGKLSAGAGMGLSVVSINAIAALAQEENEKGALFSGLNAGLLAGIASGVSVGAGISSIAGYREAYFGAAVITVICMLFAMNFILINKVESVKNKNKESINMWQFIRKKEIYSLLLFVVLPFLMLMYFKDYLFPLFASEQGMNEVAISNVFLFCGTLLIYVGPGITSLCEKKLGGKISCILASIIFIVALFIFGLHPSLYTSILSVLFIYLGGSFGLSSLSMYYSGLPAVSQYGGGKAMGIYSLFDNAGQTLGPIVISAALILGYGGASILMGAASAVLLALFIFTNCKGKKKKGEYHE